MFIFKIQDHFDPHSKGTKVFPRLLLSEIMLLCYNSPINRIIYKIGSKNYFIDQCKTVLLHTIQKFQVTENLHIFTEYYKSTTTYKNLKFTLGLVQLD